MALFNATAVMAATADGAGPWADSVVSSTQGLRKNGTAVVAERSNPTAALGQAENDTVGAHFFSLGFGGAITLGFDNPIQSGIVVVEATGGTYPNETAKVEVSTDGSNWFLAGNVTFDGAVSLPERVSCAKYVRLTDVTDPSLFTEPQYAEADGFDVDGVKAVGTQCEVPQVPEFGLVTGIVALAGSAGTYILARRRQKV
jgi:hypothetical protein